MNYNSGISKSFLIIVLSFLLFNNVQAQITITGSVLNDKGEPIKRANVVLKKKDGVVASFTITNQLGNFILSEKNAVIADSLQLFVTAIGFAESQLAVTKNNQVSNFLLHWTETKLPDVIVKSNTPMLKKEGDTLIYDVGKFSAVQDRTIEDIIKKLPGVQVLDNGEVLYGGFPINKFYIDGDELLGGKYNIATKGVQKELVSKIQILENHQPVKALKGNVYSESAAINIVLTEKARLKVIASGDASLGAPTVYNTTLNSMFFKKKLKFINYIKIFYAYFYF